MLIYYFKAGKMKQFLIQIFEKKYLSENIYLHNISLALLYIWNYEILFVG